MRAARSTRKSSSRRNATCRVDASAQGVFRSEPQIGALLPCNVVVRVDSAGKTIVEIMDPRAVLQLVDRPEIAAIAAQVRERLERVLASL